MDNCRRTERPGNCPWKPLPQLPDPTAEKPGCLDTSFQTQFMKVWRPQKTEKTDFFLRLTKSQYLKTLHLCYGPPSCSPPGPRPGLPWGSLNLPHHGSGDPTLQTRTFKISVVEEHAKVTSWSVMGLCVQIQVTDSRLWAPSLLLAEDCSKVR